MDKDKQIEEIAGCVLGGSAEYRLEVAELVYNKGYRKQSKGEWIAKNDYAGYGYYCSNCNAVFTGENAEWIAKEHRYCPHCGAKMSRKEDEGK